MKKLTTTTPMTTPDEIAKELIRAAKSGDSEHNVMDYATVKLAIWREQIRQEEIGRCASLWKVNLVKPMNEVKP